MTPEPMAAEGGHVNPCKLLLVANTDWYLYNFRLSLARLLRDRGWEVGLVSPKGDYADALRAEGFRWMEIPMRRSGRFIPQETLTTARIVGLYRRERPDLVHHFTMKSVLHGSIAARMVGIPAVINSITGLGYLYLGHGIAAWSARLVAEPFLRFGLRHSGCRVIFENSSDRDFFVARHLVGEARAIVIEGVGVDLSHYKLGPEPEGLTTVLMACRVLRDKGVGEFVDASRILKSSGKQYRFVMVGAPDPGNPRSIPEDEINRWTKEGVIEWWGQRSHMPEVYAGCHIVALPSYSEGLPTVLIEAAASGRPIVATDIPGNRSVVNSGENGYLVPVGDAQALAKAILTLAEDPHLRAKMGLRGRQRAEEEFDQRAINQRTLEVYESVGFASLST